MNNDWPIIVELLNTQIIPGPLHAWYWFKHNIIENTTNREFAQSFEKWNRKILRPVGFWPKRFKKSKSARARFLFITQRYWEMCLKPNEYFIIKEGAFGLGLFSLTSNINEFIDHVDVKVVYIGYLALDVLHKLSSTMQVQDHHDVQCHSGIMIGALSFVKYNQNSTLQWAKLDSYSSNFLQLTDSVIPKEKSNSDYSEGRIWWKLNVKTNGQTFWNTENEVMLKYKRFCYSEDEREASLENYDTYDTYDTYEDQTDGISNPNEKMSILYIMN